MANDEVSMPRLLLVEDDAANAQIIAMACRRAGFSVLTASNGLEALELLAIERLDVVLMDASLPGLDGLEVTRRLKRNRTTAEIPVIMVTARAMPEERRAMEAAGADEVVIKPCSMRELVHRIDQCMRQAAAVAWRPPGA